MEKTKQATRHVHSGFHPPGFDKDCPACNYPAAVRELAKAADAVLDAFKTIKSFHYRLGADSIHYPIGRLRAALAAVKSSNQ